MLILRFLGQIEWKLLIDEEYIPSYNRVSILFLVTVLIFELYWEKYNILLRLSNEINPDVEQKYALELEVKFRKNDW